MDKKNYKIENFLIRLPNSSHSPDNAEMLALREFAASVVKENTINVQNSSNYIRYSFWSLYVMYCLLFLIGLGTAICAVIKGLQTNTTGEAIGALVIGGLSAASFFSLFLARPLESLERNSIYASWLTMAVNTYWTRLLYFSKLETIDKDLENATDDLVKYLKTLADKHAVAIGKYPSLVSPEPKKEDQKQ